MIAVAVAVVLFVVVAGAAWARFNSARAERRSLEGYERTLDLLGDVAKRSDATADVHAPSEAELARPHVRPANAHDFPGPARSAVRIVPPAQVRLEPPILPGHPGVAKLPVFGDEDLLDADVPAAAQGTHADPGATDEPLTEVVQAVPPAEPSRAEPAAVEPPPTVEPSSPEPLTEVVPVVAAIADVDESPLELASLAADEEGQVVFDFDHAGEAAPSGRLALPRSARPSDGQTIRRAATGAAAAVVVGAIVVGSLQLASHKSPPAAGQTGNTPSTTVPTSTTPARSGGHAKATPPARTLPTTLRPTSTSATVVTYEVPAGSYTVSLKATAGVCWLGAQSQVNTSAYLQMWTLQPGESATYKASGPLVIKIGAPRYVDIEVDGKPVVLPAGNVQAYDVSFMTSSGTTV